MDVNVFYIELDTVCALNPDESSATIQGRHVERDQPTLELSGGWKEGLD